MNRWNSKELLCWTVNLEFYHQMWYNQQYNWQIVPLRCSVRALRAIL